MRTTVRSDYQRGILIFSIEFTNLERVGLPSFCSTLTKDIERFESNPYAIVDTIVALARQIRIKEDNAKRKLGSPPPLGETLETEPSKAMGSEITGDTEDVMDTINSAPETSGAPLSKENGGEAIVDTLEGFVDDLSLRIARLELWAMHVAGVNIWDSKQFKGLKKEGNKAEK